jgi:hypothetical protein
LLCWFDAGFAATAEAVAANNQEDREGWFGGGMLPLATGGRGRSGGGFSLWAGLSGVGREDAPNREIFARQTTGSKRQEAG